MSNKWKVRSPENDFLFAPLAESKVFLSGKISISRLKFSLLSDFNWALYYFQFSEQMFIKSKNFSLYRKMKYNKKIFHWAQKTHWLCQPSSQLSIEKKQKKLIFFLLCLCCFNEGMKRKKCFNAWRAPYFLLNKYSDCRNISTRTDVTRSTLKKSNVVR